MTHYLLVGIFSKWLPVKVVLMFYTLPKLTKASVTMVRAGVIFSDMGGGGKLSSIFCLNPI